MLRDSPCELACQHQQHPEAGVDTGEVVRLGESVRDGTMCGDRYREKLTLFIALTTLKRILESYFTSEVT